MTIKTERSSHDRDRTNLHPKHEGNSPHLSQKNSKEVRAISQLGPGYQKTKCMKNGFVVIII